MTLSKLSLRNARRQARDYLVYFVTVVLAAALLYAFNGLVFSDEVRSLAQGLDTLPVVIFLASIVVVFIFGWLVSYSTRFMLTRRSRELGLYILSGVTNRQVARLFSMENLAVGIVSLFFGVALGGLLYQVMRAIVLSLFGLPYHFSLTLSIPAVLLTAGYLTAIYLYALQRNRRRIRRMKIYDLIYYEKQNEDVVIRAGKARRKIFFVSIVSGVVGTCLLMAGGTAVGIVGAGCVVFFLFGFFISFSSGIPAFFDRRPARKYQGQNLIVFRTLTAKLATMGVVMAIISIIFTATLLTEGGAFMINGLVKGRAVDNACFDLYLSAEGEEKDFAPYLDYIAENIPVEQSVLYRIYLSGGTQVMDYIYEHTDHKNYGYASDPVLRFSDYTMLRSMAGYPVVEPEPGKYLIHCKTFLEEPLRGYAGILSLNGDSLTAGSIHTEHLSQGFYDMTNGRDYILVIPDEAADGLEIHHTAYAAKTAEPVTETQLATLTDMSGQDYDEQTDPEGDVFVDTKANEENMAAMQILLLVFPLFYVALALTMTAAAILTIQQLSETDRYRRQFVLLRKLGMNRQEMACTLRNQFAFYYIMPVVPAVLISVPFILKLCHQPEPGVMVGFSSPAAIITISLSVFFLIYAIYILLAYTSLKRNVLPK